MKRGRLKRHIRLIQAVLVAVCLPALMLADSVPIPLITASLVGLAIAAGIGLLATGEPVVRTPVDGALALLLTATAVNWAITTDRALTLPHVTKTVAGVAAAYAVAGILREKGWFRLAAWGICLLGLALVPFVLFGTNWTGTSKLSWIPYTITRELASRFQVLARPEEYDGFNINLAGGALAMLLPIVLAHTLFHRNWLVKAVTAVESALIGGLLLFTQSRGALAALLASMGAMLVARNWRWIIVVALVAAGGYVVLEETDLLARASTVDLEADFDSALNSAAGRVELWSRGIYMAQDFPLTGVGLGITGAVLPLRYPLFRISAAARIEHLHSLYFSTVAEMGVPGLVTMLATLGGLLVHTAQRSTDSSQRSATATLLLGLLGMQVVVLVHGVTDTIFYAPKAYVLAWALYGVALAAETRR
jgi:O-antigen ligase